MQDAGRRKQDAGRRTKGGGWRMEEAGGRSHSERSVAHERDRLELVPAARDESGDVENEERLDDVRNRDEED